MWMVIDVESVGLHGEGFAYAAVVIDGAGAVLREECVACPPEAAQGDDAARPWVASHVSTAGADAVATPREVRERFWASWRRWSAEGAALAADSLWPVEARFVAACVDDDPSRCWDGPYPFHEIASLVAASGRPADQRRAGETPEHHPLADARQSARILSAAVAAVNRGTH